LASKQIIVSRSDRIPWVRKNIFWSENRRVLDGIVSVGGPQERLGTRVELASVGTREEIHQTCPAFYAEGTTGRSTDLQEIEK
jgi:hypothetical protein